MPRTFDLDKSSSLESRSGMLGQGHGGRRFQRSHHFDQGSGKIFYDSDGTGSAAAVLFATVNPGTSLSAADFHVHG